MGLYTAFDWGWPNWGFDWRRHALPYHRDAYRFDNPSLAFHDHRGGMRPFAPDHDRATFGHGPFGSRPAARIGVPMQRGAFAGGGREFNADRPQFRDGGGWRGGSFGGGYHDAFPGGDRGTTSFGEPMHIGSFEPLDAVRELRGGGGDFHASEGGFHGGGGRR
ncbi:MAG TPA: hypothetical protein VMV45_14560 [Casimicrobiaceae bacterium]|nr:hypothetical protein [Casimicrobiaceae bacterium]